MSGRTIPFLALLALLANATAARADEIRLKDGTKINGTIVGFENDSFRVETSYGFALVRKDKVSDINISVAKTDPEPKAKTNTPAAPPPTAKPMPSPAVAKESPPPTNTPAVVNASASERPPAAANASLAPMKAQPPPVKTTAASAPPPPPVPSPAPLPAPPSPPPTPPPPPEPTVIHDEIRGTLYLNYTYGFQIYKPPSWDMIPEARKALPDAVAALGTSDHTTLLVIGRAPAKDSLDTYATAAAKALSSVYANYRLISTRRLTMAGVPAVEQRSRGTADGRDWSVIMLTIVRGTDAYTMLGMTWADSDLIQVQENVISKAVSSLTFVGR